MTTNQYLIRELACEPIQMPDLASMGKMRAAKRLREARMRIAYVRSLFESAGAKVLINEDDQLMISEGQRPAVPGDQSQKTEDVFTVVANSSGAFEHQFAELETEASVLWDAISELHAFLQDYERAPVVMTWTDYGCGIGSESTVRHYAVVGTTSEEAALSTVKSWLKQAPISETPDRLKAFKAAAKLGANINLGLAAYMEARFNAVLKDELAGNHSLKWLRRCAESGRLAVADNIHLDVQCALEVDAEIKGSRATEQFRLYVAQALENIRHAPKLRLERPSDPGVSADSTAEVRFTKMAEQGAPLSIEIKLAGFVDRAIGTKLVETIGRFASRSQVEPLMEVRIDGRMYDAVTEDKLSKQTDKAGTQNSGVSVQFESEDNAAPLRAV